MRTGPVRAVELLFGAYRRQVLGHAKESQHALDEMIAKRAQGFAYEIAGVYAWRDEKDKAFEWLELAYRGREEDLTFIKQDPALASLHGDPRFSAMLRKINLPE